MTYLYDLHFHRALPIGEICSFYNENIGFGTGSVLIDNGAIKIIDLLTERVLAKALRRSGIHLFLETFDLYDTVFQDVKSLLSCVPKVVDMMKKIGLPNKSSVCTKPGCKDCVVCDGTAKLNISR